jgi:hypothetical protein
MRRIPENAATILWLGQSGGKENVKSMDLILYI